MFEPYIEFINPVFKEKSNARIDENFVTFSQRF